VLGFTYNLENQDTNYKNGVDMHLDWGASRFVTKEWQIGLVGYFYNQVTCDSGSGDRLDCVESGVLGVGPQIGHIFKVSDDYQGYLNLKGTRNSRRSTAPRAGTCGLHSRSRPRHKSRSRPSRSGPAL